MGLCLCKDDSSSSDNKLCNCKSRSCPSCCFKWGINKRSLLNHSSENRRSEQSNHASNTNGGGDEDSIISDPNFVISVTPEVIDDLVIQTLVKLRTLVGNEDAAPQSMLKLHNIAEHEEGWILVVNSLVNAIPTEDPLGPAVISLLLDDCPLPSRENAMQLSQHLDLVHSSKYDDRQKRNICIILGCLAEKLAGQNSTILLNKEVTNFIMSHLNKSENPSVILHSIIALEKFAQTSENKFIISRLLQSSEENPLVILEKWSDHKAYDKRQVGFCAQWCLDNIFLMDDREFGYEIVDNAGINVILNSYDVSEYLKISPNGLEARCDASSFESVRSTFQVDSGSWFYECLIITEGVMQIGWATKASKFLNHDGYGIGDDEFSVAVDLCRQVTWFHAQSEPLTISRWKPGDILGTYLDLDKLEIIFYLNGNLVKSHKEVFKHTKSGFFAASSFMSFQQCQFNFGSKPFKFPPNGKNFKNFNEYAKLGDETRIVLPRHLKMEYLRKVSVKENSCNLCFDNIADVRLLPCQHCGFCGTCADQLTCCPLCRKLIENKITMYETV